MADHPHSAVLGDPDYSEVCGYGVTEYAITFLGLFRRKVGRDIEELAAIHGIAIEGPLQETVALTGPLQSNERALRMAEALTRPYMQRHRGFKNMTPDWYEDLCRSLGSYRDPWR